MINEPNAPSAARHEAGRSLPWHSLPVPDVLIAAGTQMTGLSEASAAARLIEFGPNRLVPVKPVSAAAILKINFERRRVPARHGGDHLGRAQRLSGGEH